MCFNFTRYFQLVIQGKVMTIEVDLSNVSFCILGVKASGKSTAANIILSECGESSLYYDTLGESPKSARYNYYIPKDRYSVAELENVIIKITPQSGQSVETFTPPYSMFIIDETNRFCPPKPHPLPPKVADLNDQNRHYLMSVGYVARRPSQLNSDLIELANYLFIFRLTGKNDLIYLDSTVKGLAAAVSNLDKFQFVLVHPDKHYQICNALKPNIDWLRRSDNIRQSIK
jgi:DNA helicase HerA-like ATPase